MLNVDEARALALAYFCALLRNRFQISKICKGCILFTWHRPLRLLAAQAAAALELLGRPAVLAACRPLLLQQE